MSTPGSVVHAVYRSIDSTTVRLPARTILKCIYLRPVRLSVRLFATDVLSV